MRASPPDMLIISGLSGSGKSVALQSLEDIGYYCIDNLPAVLLPEFGRHLSAGGDEKKPPASDAESYQSASDLSGGAAVSIDSRNAHFYYCLNENLNENLRELERARYFFSVVIFTSRRANFNPPLQRNPPQTSATDHRTPLVDGIRQERLLLQSLHDRADKIIDTSATTPHELRGVIRDFAVGAAVKGPLFYWNPSALNSVHRARRILFLMCVACRIRTGKKITRANRTRFGCAKISRRTRQRASNGRTNSSLPTKLVARFQSRKPQLLYRRHRLHRRSASLGLYRRSALR